MDPALLVDICVAIATASCIALLIYGLWLCLPGSGAGRPEGSQHGGEIKSGQRQGGRSPQGAVVSGGARAERSAPPPDF